MAELEEKKASLLKEQKEKGRLLKSKEEMAHEKVSSTA